MCTISQSFLQSHSPLSIKSSLYDLEFSSKHLFPMDVQTGRLLIELPAPIFTTFSLFRGMNQGAHPHRFEIFFTLHSNKQLSCE